MPVDHSQRIGAMVLAAGASTRMGRPKQLIKCRGVSLVRRAARAALSAGCQPVVVVTGAHADLVGKELQGLPVEVILNPDWETGMGSSIRTGVKCIQNLDLNLSAVVMLLCDQPYVTDQTISGLTARYRESGSSIVASQYDNNFGVPALFSRTLFPELMRLGGTEGAKQVIKGHASEVTLVLFPGGAVDLDTQDDLGRFVDEGKMDPDPSQIRIKPH